MTVKHSRKLIIITTRNRIIIATHWCHSSQPANHSGEREPNGYTPWKGWIKGRFISLTGGNRSGSAQISPHCAKKAQGKTDCFWSFLFQHLQTLVDHRWLKLWKLKLHIKGRTRKQMAHIHKNIDTHRVIAFQSSDWYTCSSNFYRKADHDRIDIIFKLFIFTWFYDHPPMKLNHSDDLHTSLLNDYPMICLMKTLNIYV